MKSDTKKEFLAGSISDIKYSIKKIKKRNAKWKTDICPNCKRRLKEAKSYISKIPVYECPSCSKQFNKAERVLLEDLTVIKNLEKKTINKEE